MTAAFDPRLVELTIQLPDQTILSFQDVAIFASGRKYTSALMNECEARIFNLTPDQRNNILTQASPLKLGLDNPPVSMLLSVGRQSYGTFLLFQGNVISCNVTQPPDIGISLRGLTNNFAASIIVGANQSSIATLSAIAQGIADAQGLALSFQATDKQIDNYSWSGASSRQIDKLNQMGGVRAYIDNGILVVQDSNAPRAGQTVSINAANGMVGVPQVTEFGVIVKVMIDPAIQLGGAVTVESAINPAANGTYYVVQIDFDVANRETPFWYTLSCQTPSRFIGTQ